MDLSEVKTDDLVEEMERRKKEIERPKPDGKNDFFPLIKTTESIMIDITKQGWSKDQKQWVYESAMECIYGKNVWEWINKYDEGC